MSLGVVLVVLSVESVARAKLLKLMYAKTHRKLAKILTLGSHLPSSSRSGAGPALCRLTGGPLATL